MSADLLAILGCCILGLVAHGARQQRWLEWVLRGLYVLVLGGELLNLTVTPEMGEELGELSHASAIAVAVGTGLMLFKPAREGLSYILTIINQFISGRVFLAALGLLKVPVEAPRPLVVSAVTAGDTTAAFVEPAREVILEPASTTRKLSILQSFVAERVFVPASIPHLNGLWIYITCLGYLIANTEMKGISMPMLPVPFPVTLDQLFNYNGLGLVMLALCGVGIMVGRKPKEALTRLGLVKPTLKQVGIGVFMIFFTFFYDYVWSIFTHGQAGMEYADKLARYNDGTFSVGGGAAPPAFTLALFTGLCAGIGEETLIRGALQPVFGIFPAAFLHGALHGQFSHAPLLILQVAGWSTLMGIVRRYTNTTTTIITHAGFNFLSSFLFAFNP